MLGSTRLPAPVGVALCDAVDWMRDLSAVADRLAAVEALEFQPELLADARGYLAWPAPHLRVLLQERLPALRYVSVHAPSSRHDLSAPAEAPRRQAVAAARTALAWAADLGAEAFVLHPGHLTWDDAAGREARANAFRRSFAELAQAWHERNGGRPRPRLLLENLEYPHLGATPSELRALALLCDSQVPLGVCLDVPHLWHTRRLLHLPENSGHRRRMLPPDVDAPSFGGYLRQSTGELPAEVSLLHLAGCGLHKTHEPVHWRGGEATPEPGEPGEGIYEMLDLRPVLRHLEAAPPLTSRPWILEVYFGGLAALGESVERVLRFRSRLAGVC